MKTSKSKTFQQGTSMQDLSAWIWDQIESVSNGAQDPTETEDVADAKYIVTITKEKKDDLCKE